MLTSDTKVQNLIHELGISQPKIVDITKEQRKSITNHFKFLLNTDFVYSSHYDSICKLK